MNVMSLLKKGGKKEEAEPVPPAAPQPAAEEKTETKEEEVQEEVSGQDDHELMNLIETQLKEIHETVTEKVAQIEKKVEEMGSKGGGAANNEELEKKLASLDKIEANMEKFMRLYEVISNQYNPFVAEPGSEQKEEIAPAAESFQPAMPPEGSGAHEEQSMQQPTQVAQPEQIAVADPAVPLQPSMPQEEQPATATPAVEQGVPAPVQEPTPETTEESVSTTGETAAPPPENPVTRESASPPAEMKEAAPVAAAPAVEETKEAKEEVQAPTQPPTEGAEQPGDHEVAQRAAQLHQQIEEALQPEAPVPESPVEHPIPEKPVQAPAPETERMAQSEILVEDTITKKIERAPVKTHSVESQAAFQQEASRLPPGVGEPPNAGKVTVKERVEVPAQGTLTEEVVVEQTGKEPLAEAIPKAETQALAQLLYKLSKEQQQAFTAQATTLLHQTDQDHAFWTRDNVCVRTLLELIAAVREMSDETFFQHVNEQKNDFAQWIRYTLQQHELAGRIERVRSREEFLATINQEAPVLQAFQQEEQQPEEAAAPVAAEPEAAVSKLDLHQQIIAPLEKFYAMIGKIDEGQFRKKFIEERPELFEMVRSITQDDKLVAALQGSQSREEMKRVLLEKILTMKEEMYSMRSV